jgi:hypothetical protein
VAYALMRAASSLNSTLVCFCNIQFKGKRRDESKSRRGTHECVRHISYFNSFTWRSDGNSHVQSRTIAIVPMPPRTTAGTVPNHCAVNPDSN